jgi:arylsulfate sulfotransferase
MKSRSPLFLLIPLLSGLCAPASAAVQIISMKASVKSPQPLGTAVAFVVRATDSNSGPLAFQYKIAPHDGAFSTVRDFNLGTVKGSVWFSPSFVWAPSSTDGTYKIQVNIKDFASGETATKTVRYTVTPIATTVPVVKPTANPLVALFSAPSCAAGDFMRVHFKPQTGTVAAATTNWVACHPPHSMAFEVAGMYPTTVYEMYSQTKSGSNIVNGSPLTFHTGALPKTIPFPKFQVLVPAGAQADSGGSVLLHGSTRLGTGVHFPQVATDLSGQVIWYYLPPDNTDSNFITRPLGNGTMMTIQSGSAWNSAAQGSQLLRQIDLAGHVLRETNTGIIQQQLLAKGAADAGPCNVITTPQIGSSCLGAFHHDFIASLPNGYTAFLADIEKIFPPGTQGDSTGMPVDVMGDMIVVLDADWQVAWYFDTFEHAEGPPSKELDINRAALLGETCMNSQVGCPPMFLLASNISPKAMDWLHANSLYYWPQTHDIIWSARHQDWVMRIDYQDGKGTGDILWRMGPDGDFTFNNVNNDVWPWFSHQHDVGIEDNGAGVISLFDNGNTRVSDTPLGLGSNCGPSDCHSRGMALTFDEHTMTVTPALSVDLGYFATAMGSAQKLSSGNYFFVPAIVVITPQNINSFNIQVLSDGSTMPVFNLEGPEVYRGWQMPSLYEPPIT